MNSFIKRELEIIVGNLEQKIPPDSSLNIASLGADPCSVGKSGGKISKTSLLEFSTTENGLVSAP
jgi:hypothetical protein